jgi:hypothetical protein
MTWLQYPVRILLRSIHSMLYAYNAQPAPLDYLNQID